MKMKPFFSLIVPCYNEGRRLITNLVTIMTFFDEQVISVEVIVVDDGSTDDSKKILRSVLKNYPIRVLRHAKNRGKGAAIRTGMKEARGEWVGFMDADLATPVSEWPRFWNKLEQKDAMVIGTRKNHLARVTIRQPWMREQLGKIFTLLSNVILNLRVSDVSCGMKVWPRSISNKIWGKQRLNDWSFDAEILYLCRKQKIAIVEVPVEWADQPETKVRWWLDGMRSLWGLIKIRLDDVRGEYD